MRDPTTWQIGLVAVLVFAGVSLFFEPYSPYQNYLQSYKMGSDYREVDIVHKTKISSRSVSTLCFCQIVQKTCQIVQKKFIPLYLIHYFMYIIYITYLAHLFSMSTRIQLIEFIENYNKNFVEPNTKFPIGNSWVVLTKENRNTSLDFITYEPAICIII